MTYDGLWKIRYDEHGEQIFDFDIVHLKKGGAIEVTQRRALAARMHTSGPHPP